VFAAQEADILVDDVQHAAAEDIALPFGLGAQQPQDQVFLLQAAVARHVQRFGQIAQLGQRFRFQFFKIKIHVEPPGMNAV